MVLEECCTSEDIEGQVECKLCSTSQEEETQCTATEEEVTKEDVEETLSKIEETEIPSKENINTDSGVEFIEFVGNDEDKVEIGNGDELSKECSSGPQQKDTSSNEIDEVKSEKDNESSEVGTSEACCSAEGREGQTFSQKGVCGTHIFKAIYT